MYTSSTFYLFKKIYIKNEITTRFNTIVNMLDWWFQALEIGSGLTEKKNIFYP